jgi:hypothetical protein
MQSEVEKFEALQLKVWNNLSHIVDEIKAGQWQINYDKEVDEFYWSNLNSSPDGNSVILPVDKYFCASINKRSGAIEYLRIEYFDTIFVKENPELKKFAKLVKKNSTDRHTPLEFIQGLIGRLITTGTASDVRLATAAACA